MNTIQSGYISLLQRFTSVHRSELSQKVLLASQKTAISLILLVIFAVMIETVAQGDIAFRTALFAFIAVAFFGCAFTFLFSPFLEFFGLKKSFYPYEIAKRIGNYYPNIRDTLVNVFQLAEQTTESSNHELVYAAFDSVYEQSKNIDFHVIVEKEKNRKFLLFLAAAIIGFGIVVTVPVLRSSLNRIIHFSSSFLPPAPFSLSVEPQSTLKLRGEKAVVVVNIKGTIPNAITIKVREMQQENFDSHELKPDANGKWTYTFSSLSNTVEFYAESPWLSDAVRSNIGTIIVQDKPIIKSLSGKVYSPSYTQQPVLQLSEDAADIIALRGAKTELRVVSNKTLREAYCVFLQYSQDSTGTKTDTIRKAMTLQNKSASTTFSLSNSCDYYIEIKDQDGLTNDSPVHYKIVVQDDNSPTITLLTPQNDIAIDATAILPVKISANDDFGFSSLLLHYRLVESKYGKTSDKFTAVSIPFPRNEKSMNVPYFWDLTKLNISPSDKYEFYCEIFDNDIIAGPKSARTQTINVKLPSLDEVLNESGKQEEQIRKELEEIAKQADQAQKEMEKIQRELRKDKQPDWQDKKKLEDAIQQQKELQKKLDDVVQKMEDMSKNLQNNNAISKETLEKYQELQQLMKEVQSPELQKAMERIQQAMQQMSQQQLQEAMKQYQFNEEQFKKQIERSLNIMKRLKAEQLTDALTKRSEQLEKKLQDLQKQTENTNTSDRDKRQELAEKQRDMSDEAKEIREDMKKLENVMKEIQQQMPMDKLQDAKQELGNEQNDIANDMEQAAEEMQNGQQEKSSQKQQSAAKKAKQFAQKMKALKKEMKKNLSKEVQKQMQKSVSDLLDLSQKQEQLRKNSQQLDPNSAQYSQNAQEQKKMQEQLNTVAQRMAEISQKTMALTPEMARNIGEAMQKMQQSSEQLTNRNGQQAAQQQGQAMSSMNKAAMQMQQAMQGMKGQGEGQEGEGEDGQDGEGEGNKKGKGKNGKSPGGFMQRLQQMAGQQQQINQGMQNMQRLQSGQNGQPTPQQQAEMGRLAAQQGKAMQAMQELAKEQQEQVGGKKGLGSLEKIAQEMKEVMTDMETGAITDETIKRQDKILSRLLDATLSMNERDYEKKRESKSGQDIMKKSPGILQNGLQQFNNSNSLEENKVQFTKDYEKIIRLYLDELSKQPSSR